MLLLDTDVLSLIQRGIGPRYEALLKLLNESDDEVWVTIISLDEQLHGAINEIASNQPKVRIRGYRRLHDLVDDYRDRPLLDYEEDAEAIFEKLKSLKGRPATKDLRIACIALLHNATLITGNARDFRKIQLLKLRSLP